MELKEYIYKLCTDTDMTDPEAATELAQTLSMNLLRLDSVCKKQEDKLQEVMSAKDYKRWAMQTAKELFREEVGNMPDGEFKEFATENMEWMFEEVDRLQDEHNIY